MLEQIKKLDYEREALKYKASQMDTRVKASAFFIRYRHDDLIEIWGNTHETIGKECSKQSKKIDSARETDWRASDEVETYQWRAYESSKQILCFPAIIDRSLIFDNGPQSRKNSRGLRIHSIFWNWLSFSTTDTAWWSTRWIDQSEERYEPEKAPNCRSKDLKNVIMTCYRYERSECNGNGLTSGSSQRQVKKAKSDLKEKTFSTEKQLSEYTWFSRRSEPSGAVFFLRIWKV